MRAIIPIVPIALLALSGSALADCPRAIGSVSSINPPKGSTNAPINSQVSFGITPLFAGYNAQVVLSSNGVAVPGTVQIGPGGTLMFVPTAQLSPNTTYHVSIMDQTSGGTPATASFTTGTSQDLTAPTMPGPPDLRLDQYVPETETGNCLRPGFWNLHVSWGTAVSVSPVLYSLNIVEVDQSGDQGFAPGMVPRQGVITSANEIELPVPDNTQVTIYVYALDEAGRQGASPASTILAPLAPAGANHGAGCACRVAEDGGKAPLLALSFAGVLLLAIRRRLRA